MIYHLLHYCQTNLPALNFVVEGALVNDPQERVELMVSGGSSRGYPDSRIDDQARFRILNQNQYVARETAFDVFNLMRESFDTILQPHPESATGEVPILINRWQSMHTPLPAGRDEKGLYIYYVDIQITYSY